MTFVIVTDIVWRSSILAIAILDVDKYKSAIMAGGAFGLGLITGTWAAKKIDRQFKTSTVLNLYLYAFPMITLTEFVLKKLNIKFY